MSSKPAWQYRRRDEGTLHGPYDDEKILSWFGKPRSSQEAKDLEFRNIMDADVAWMPITQVLARFKTDMCTVHSDSSSQDDSASALTSHCGYGSFTGVSPPSSDEQPDSSQVPTPRDNQSLVLTAPPSPEHRFSKRISHKDAFDVTLGRVADKVAYRSASEGRPGSHHTKNVMKNYVCWCLIPDKHAPGQPEFAWGPLKLEEVLLAAYENVVLMDTLLAVVDASVPDYVMHPSADILKLIAMPFHEHIVAHQRHSPVTWSIRQIEDFVGPSAVQHTSTVNSELLDTAPRNAATHLPHHMNGMSSDVFDSLAWPESHLDLPGGARVHQRPRSCNQLPPISVLQHQQARHHGGLTNNRALDDMFAPIDSYTVPPHPSVRRPRNDPRAPVVHGFDDWQGKKFIVDEETRQRLKSTMIEMVKNSVVPPVETKLPPALANPPPPQSRQMPALTMCIPEHSSGHMQQMPMPATARQYSSHTSLRNSFSQDELLSFACAPARSRASSRAASYSQVPQEFNIHAADFTPGTGEMLSAAEIQSTMDSHVQSDMERIASSFSGQLEIGGSNLSMHGSAGQGLFTHSEAAPTRQTDPGTLHGHSMMPTDPAAAASAAAAVLNSEQLNSVLAQMASKMNCPPAHMQDLLHSLTQAARLQAVNSEMNSPTRAGKINVLNQAVTSQPPVNSRMGQWPVVSDSGARAHPLESQPLNHSNSQALHQTLLPTHQQPLNPDFPRHRGMQGHSIGANAGMGNYGGFGGAHHGTLNGSLGTGSGGFGSGNFGSGGLGDVLGRSHGLGPSGGFNDSLRCMDIGLGQM